MIAEGYDECSGDFQRESKERSTSAPTLRKPLLVILRAPRFLELLSVFEESCSAHGKFSSNLVLRIV